MPALPKAQQHAINKLRQPALTGEEKQDLIEQAAMRGWSAVVEEGVRLHDTSRSALDLNRLLWLASVFGRDHADTVEVLLRAGSDPNAPKVMAQCGLASLPMLWKAGGDLNRASSEKPPLLFATIDRNKQDKALALIEAGANVNIADSDGVTALMHAAALGRNKVFDALIAAGADLYAVDNSGRSVARHLSESLTGGTHLSTDSDRKSALRLARQLRQMLPAQPEDRVLLTIALGDARELKTMLDGGFAADTMIAGSMGLIGLSLDDIMNQWKEQGGLFEALEAGAAFPNTAERDQEMGGMTLLMWATAMRQPDCIRVLLEHGAGPKQANAGGVSALSIAEARSGYQLTIQQLSGGEELAAANDKGGAERAHQIGYSESALLKLLDDHRQRLTVGIEGKPRPIREGRFAYLAGNDHWEIACLEHLLHQTDACRGSLEAIVELADACFFGTHFQVSKAETTALRREIEWQPFWTRALAAASALGHWEQVDKLLTYPDDRCPRGEKSPTYCPEWYQWPLWMHLARVARGEASPPGWADAMKKESTRMSKGMHAAEEAIAANNSAATQKAIDRIVQAQAVWHKSLWKAIRPEQCVSAEATFFLHRARQKSLAVECAADGAPFVFTFS